MSWPVIYLYRSQHRIIRWHSEASRASGGGELGWEAGRGMAVAPGTGKPSVTQQPPNVLCRAPLLRFTRSLGMSAAGAGGGRQWGGKLRAVSAASSSGQPLLADAAHREEIRRLAQSSLSNCLTETHLDLSVPGLGSKSRGKVSRLVSNFGAVSPIRLCHRLFLWAPISVWIISSNRWGTYMRRAII